MGAGEQLSGREVIDGSFKGWSSGLTFVNMSIYDLDTHSVSLEEFISTVAWPS